MFSPKSGQPPRHICFIIPTVPPQFSGGGLLAYNLAQHMSEDGYDVSIVTKTPNPRPIERVELRTLSSMKASGNAKLDRLIDYGVLFPRALAILRSLSPDVIHIMSCDMWTLTCLSAAKTLDIPVLIETSLAGADDPLTIRHSRLGGLKFRMLRAADLLVSVSPLLDDLAHDAGIPPYRRRIIGNQVDVERFTPATAKEKRELREKLALEAFDRILLNVAILRPRKGIALMVEAFAEAAKDDPNLGLVLVGPTEKDSENRECTRDTIALAKKLGVEDRLVITGLVDNVEDYMRASDLFFFASEQEGFGTVVVEAMAAGLPVLVKRIEGISHFIIDQGVNGRIVESDDAFIQALLEMLADEATLESFGEAGRENVLARFSADVIATAYLQAYADITPDTTV